MICNRLFLVVTSVCSAYPAHAQSNDSREVFFETNVRPALVAKCYRCHSSDSGRALGGLTLDRYEAMLRGGRSGPAVVPGSPDESLLLTAIEYEDEDLQMPPSGKLDPDTIEMLRSWIASGANGATKRPQITPPPASNIDIDAGRAHWAYQQPRRPRPPQVVGEDWPRSTIDRFVLHGLEQKGLAPGADADPYTLVRRLAFVLTGLPLSPEETNEWTGRISAARNGLQEQEVAALVDELLASPRFGEHWGRHWLDVARFAESTGGDANNIFPHAWRYRDWVIDAFNNDMPYDEFVRAQLAGDLMPASTDRELARNIVATGFLAVGMKLVGETDQRKFQADLIDDQIDSTTRAFLATTVSCARCHDHKYDPIPQRDYYALAGIFQSTRTHYGLLNAQARQSSTLIDLTDMGQPASGPSLLAPEIDELQRERDAANERMASVMKRIRSGTKVPRSELRRSRTARDRAEMALAAYDEQGHPKVHAMGTQDQDFATAAELLVRGEVDQPAGRVPRGLPQVLSSSGAHEFPNDVSGSGRLVLADWIAQPDHPLTARVLANRVWHHLFGTGLVRTVDDFGELGERPSHPELLDYLAIQLTDHEWSLKQLIRQIVLSRTWQLSSTFHRNNHAVDPDNRLLWRMNKRRLPAESIRDAMLRVSGELEVDRPVGTLLSRVGEGAVGLSVFEPDIRGIESRHRSIYLPRVRSVMPDVLAIFDAPNANLVMGARESTTSPLQALYMLNSPFVRERAAALARRVAEQPLHHRVAHAHLVVYGRPARSEDRKLASQLARRVSARGDETAWLTPYCQALLCAAEFYYID